MILLLSCIMAAQLLLTGVYWMNMNISTFTFTYIHIHIILYVYCCCIHTTPTNERCCYCCGVSSNANNNNNKTDSTRTWLDILRSACTRTGCCARRAVHTSASAQQQQASKQGRAGL